MKNKPKNNRRVANRVSFNLDTVSPLTKNQGKMFDSHRNVISLGCAGTGKTFLATYLGLEDILKKDKYSRLSIIRSSVPTRKEGFLPGTDKEKSEVYQRPYQDILTELFGRNDAHEQLKAKGVIDFFTTSYIRGNNIEDSVIIVDECQNMTFHELDSIITRVGENCRIFFCGDVRQSGDLGRYEESGLGDFYQILKEMDEFDLIEFQVEDIVRSDLVKNYLLAKYAREERNESRTQ